MPFNIDDFRAQMGILETIAHTKDLTAIQCNLQSIFKKTKLPLLIAEAKTAQEQSIEQAQELKYKLMEAWQGFHAFPSPENFRQLKFVVGEFGSDLFKTHPTLLVSYGNNKTAAQFACNQFESKGYQAFREYMECSFPIQVKMYIDNEYYSKTFFHNEVLENANTDLTE